MEIFFPKMEIYSKNDDLILHLIVHASCYIGNDGEMMSERCSLFLEKFPFVEKIYFFVKNRPT